MQLSRVITVPVIANHGILPVLALLRIVDKLANQVLFESIIHISKLGIELRTVRILSLLSTRQFLRSEDITGIYIKEQLTHATIIPCLCFELKEKQTEIAFPQLQPQTSALQFVLSQLEQAMCST